MQNIIYKSNSIIPWDTQSAFKMTSYNCHKEENMVFCYLKAYVHEQDLILCSYCFTADPSGTDALELLVNLRPDKSKNILKIKFGFDGIGCAEIGGDSIDIDSISYSPFKADDEQGFYWCGQIMLDKQLVKKYFSTTLTEKSIISLNMVQNFSGGDFSVLCGDATDEKYNAEESMEIFVILNY